MLPTALGEVGSARGACAGLGSCGWLLRLNLRLARLNLRLLGLLGLNLGLLGLDLG